MGRNKEKIIKKLLNYPYKEVEFTKNPKADDLLLNLKEYPHAFVLACIMDRGIKAERAWIIPYKISKEIGDFNFLKLSSLDLKWFEKIFEEKKLHRYKKKMAGYFHKAIQRIKKEYNGDASKIWENNPTSCVVVNRFLEFDGVGRKIATMATNILARDFKIKMKDRYCIDVSPDVQVKKVFKRLGFISKESDDELMYCTRGLNPKYPGIFDLPIWEIGRKWCYPKNPDCENCYLNRYCPNNKINL